MSMGIRHGTARAVATCLLGLIVAKNMATCDRHEKQNYSQQL